MKKSEMLSAIEKNFPMIHFTDVYNLLEFIEEQGMLPPPYKAKALIGFYVVQDWEPENETQNHTTYCDNNVEPASAERPLR